MLAYVLDKFTQPDWQRLLQATFTLQISGRVSFSGLMVASWDDISPYLFFW
jgi:hypothetical protein